jgi:hypothetical protein
MTTASGSAEILRYIRHENKDHWERQGWVATDALVGTPHGLWAVLMVWPQDQESPPQET